MAFFFFKVSLTAQGFMHRRKPRSIVSFCDIEWNNNPCFATMGFMKIETYIMLIFATLWTSVCVPGSSRYCVPLTVSLSWMMLFRKFKGFHDKPFFFYEMVKSRVLYYFCWKTVRTLCRGWGWTMLSLITENLLKKIICYTGNIIFPERF